MTNYWVWGVLLLAFMGQSVGAWSSGFESVVVFLLMVIALNSFDKEEKSLELKREYYKRLQTVVSVQKVARLSQAERGFKQHLLRNMQERRGGQKGPKGGGGQGGQRGENRG